MTESCCQWPVFFSCGDDELVGLSSSLMIYTFKKEELEELPFGSAPTGWRLISDAIVDHSRWSVTHEIIFQTTEQVGTNRAWRTTYSVGATEYQDERPWQYDETVECRLVEEIEKTIKVWEPVRGDGG